MTKLQELIERKRINKKLKANEPISYSGISKILGIPYNTVKSKCNNGTFTVQEALYLFQTFYPNQFHRFSNIPEFEEFCRLFIDNENNEEN